jgi:acetyl-CoA carboxylase carboxyl transferase subunit alpha
MGITAGRLKGLGLIDQIVEETPGGAHRDVVGMGKNLKQALEEALSHVAGLDHDALVRRRIDRLMAYGAFETTSA